MGGVGLMEAWRSQFWLGNHLIVTVATLDFGLKNVELESACHCMSVQVYERLEELGNDDAEAQNWRPVTRLTRI